MDEIPDEYTFIIHELHKEKVPKLLRISRYIDVRPNM